MAWYVRFIPNECDSISVLINNEYWTRWFRTSGDNTRALPPRFQDVPSLKIGATVSPEDKNGTIQVLWDGRLVKEYNFDNYEDHDLNNSPPPPPFHDNDHGGGRTLLIDGSNQLTDESNQVEASAITFSSGVLTLTSHFPETQARTTVELPLAGTLVAVSAESKTFRKWDSALPWHLRSTSGTDLAHWDAVSVTLLRAIDPQTGVVVVQGTCALRQTAHNWHVPQYSYQTDGLNIRIAFLDSRDGLLEAWAVTNKHVVACSDTDAYFTFKQTLRPDWYDILASVAILIDPHTWYRC